MLKAASALHNSNELSGFQISGATEEKQEINSHYIALCKRKKERKKISWPIAQYNNEMEHTIDLSKNMKVLAGAPPRGKQVQPSLYQNFP